MNDRDMNPVKENRAYVKGRGTCVNVDNSAFNARKAKIRAEHKKDLRISELESEVNELKELIKQVIKSNGN